MRTIRRLFITGLILLASASFAVEQVTPPEDYAAPPANAIKYSDGLHFIVLRPGSDEQVSEDYVQFEMTAWTRADGETRFNAAEDGESTQSISALAAYLPGFATAINAMTIGEQRRWWIDADLLLPAWGEFVPGDYTFDVALNGQLPPLAAPDNVAQAPADAVTTSSGLRYVVLKPGTGEVNPVESDTVTTHYSGWTTDGAMFDSSVMRGEPADFPVNGLIAGMTEGLMTMVVGEKKRFWIPQDLAYGETPRSGAPRGELVFDVELLEIKPAD